MIIVRDRSMTGINRVMCRIFGRVIEGREIYIKLKLAKVGKESIAKCLSFHAANFPLCFPLQDNKGGD